MRAETRICGSGTISDVLHILPLNTLREHANAQYPYIQSKRQSNALKNMRDRRSDALDNLSSLPVQLRRITFMRFFLTVFKTSALMIL